MANQFFVAPSPHVHSAESTTKIMRDVVIALLPALVVSALLFGWSVLGVTALSVVCCVVFEYLIQRFMLRGAPTVGNLSAVVTGVLLAFNLPASIPWWIVVIGAFVAIAIGKMTFGGLGKNPFNPALVGRVFLLIAYPAQMTSFPQPAGAVADAFSGATPLAAVKFGAVSASAIDYQDMLFGSIPGSLGEVAALALLAAILFVVLRRHRTCKRRAAAFDGADRAAATAALFAYAMELMWHGGLPRENGSLLQQDKAVSDWAGKPVDFPALVWLNAETRYSSHPITETQRSQMRYFADDTLRCFRRKLKPWQKLYQKWILCMY